MLDVDHVIERLIDGDVLSAEELTWVCTRVKDIVAEESNVAVVQAPVTIVGDIHGQFWDLLEMFRVGGWLPDTNYLFLGDYVDRGYYSIETISLLLCYKIRYPSRITLLRGNHETRGTSMVYGFYSECLSKYRGPQVWTAVMEVFDCLTLSALVDGRVLAVHGGLSPSLLNLDHIKVINRFQEVPRDGPFSDVMWSDPDMMAEGFSVSVRGAGYTFGRDIVDRFLHVNNLGSLVRAHQLCSEGYQILFDGKCATVWSAPNYCYRCKNKASILEVDDDMLNNCGGRPQPRHFNVFTEAPETARRRPPNAQLLPSDDEDD
ncbi:putative serine/threonine-protein phosphatase C22H10.04 [Diplonema papillatum]|nr:putative serine/threonine-protein phosphatase C22H10.04 [Diplonema papillatum]|eukprot:gene15553-23739_t